MAGTDNGASVTTRQEALSRAEQQEIMAQARVLAGAVADDAPTNRVRYGGLKQFSGIVAEEYLPKLHGVRKVETYIEMRADPQVEALLMVLKAPLLDATWTVEAGGTQARAKRAADLVERQLGVGQAPTGVDSSWQATLWKILSCFDFGFQLVAENWRDDGKEIVLDDLTDIHPRTILQGTRQWEFDDAGKVIGAWQTVYTPASSGAASTYRHEFIPIERLLHAINGQQFGDPQGRALLRSAYGPWYLKQQVMRANAIGHVRGAMGVPFGTYPPDATEDERVNFQNALENLLVSERGFICAPTGYTLENFKLEHDANNSLTTLEYYDQKMLMPILASWLQLGQTKTGGSGGKDLSGDFVDWFSRVAQYYGRFFAGLITRQTAKKIVDYNVPGLQPQLYPSLKCNVSRMSVFGYADALRKLLGQQGALVWTPEDQKDLRERMGMPKIPDGVDPTPPPPTPAGPGANPDGSQPNNPEGGQDGSLPGANK